MVSLSSRFIALSWARCCWLSALNLQGPESREESVTLYKSLSLCLAGVVLSGVALGADLVQTATLKDLQTVGTTSKKQKHQQYDLVIDTASNEYVCRTKLGGSFNPTQFVVGSPLQFKVNGQKGEAKTTDGKKTNCAVVRVAAAGGF